MVSLKELLALIQSIFPLLDSRVSVQGNFLIILFLSTMFNPYMEISFTRWESRSHVCLLHVKALLIYTPFCYFDYLYSNMIINYYKLCVPVSCPQESHTPTCGLGSWET